MYGQVSLVPMRVIFLRSKHPFFFVAFSVTCVLSVLGTTYERKGVQKAWNCAPGVLFLLLDQDFQIANAILWCFIACSMV
jgi:hypothetical protein